jgi:HSP20 family molecular chaperone IbpA
MPENAKIDEARANFRNGVLEVTVPVPESESKRRQIPGSRGAAKSPRVPDHPGG